MTDKAEYVVDRAGIEALRETCHQIAALCEQRNKTAETGKIFMAPAMSMHTDTVLALLDRIAELEAGQAEALELLKEVPELFSRYWDEGMKGRWYARWRKAVSEPPKQQEAEDDAT